MERHFWPDISRHGRGGRLAALGSAVVIAVLCSSHGAQARCRTAPYTYYPAQNDTVSVHVTCDGRGGRLGWRSRGIEFTGAKVLAHPRNGRLKDDDGLSYFYWPNPGFRGNDAYSIRICGKTLRAGEGCSTLNYQVTVQ